MTIEFLLFSYTPPTHTPLPKIKPILSEIPPFSKGRNIHLETNRASLPWSTCSQPLCLIQHTGEGGTPTESAGWWLAAKAIQSHLPPLLDASQECGRLACQIGNYWPDAVLRNGLMTGASCFSANAASLPERIYLPKRNMPTLGGYEVTVIMGKNRQA